MYSKPLFQENIIISEKRSNPIWKLVLCNLQKLTLQVIKLFSKNFFIFVTIFIIRQSILEHLKKKMLRRIIFCMSLVTKRMISKRWLKHWNKIFNSLNTLNLDSESHKCDNHGHETQDYASHSLSFTLTKIKASLVK